MGTEEVVANSSLECRAGDSGATLASRCGDLHQSSSLLTLIVIGAQRAVAGFSVERFVAAAEPHAAVLVCSAD